jgi:hypothetical protein
MRRSLIMASACWRSGWVSPDPLGRTTRPALPDRLASPARTSSPTRRVTPRTAPAHRSTSQESTASMAASAAKTTRKSHSTTWPASSRPSTSPDEPADTGRQATQSAVTFRSATGGGLPQQCRCPRRTRRHGNHRVDHTGAEPILVVDFGNGEERWSMDRQRAAAMGAPAPPDGAELCGSGCLTASIASRWLRQLFASSLRASMALTVFPSAFPKKRLPPIPTTTPSARPLKFFPSRTTTTSTAVIPSGCRVKV